MVRAKIAAPVPMLVPRVAIHDTRLRSHDVPAGTRVVVNAWAIGRDGESWGEDADAFRPERWLARGAAADYGGRDARFIPFGAGRRGCPGVGFATRLAELALASMLYHFDWELPGGQDAGSFEFVESSGITAGLKFPLTLVAEPFRA